VKHPIIGRTVGTMGVTTGSPEDQSRMEENVQ
jgi:hypothetical protein